MMPCLKISYGAVGRNPDRSPKLTIEYELNGLSTGTYYYIRNANSGLYLTASGDSSGDNLIQSPFNGGDSQKFNLLYLAQRGDYWMYPKSATDLAVQVEGSSSSNNAYIEIGSQPSVAGTHQRFKIVENDNGTFEILTRQSNYTKAVVVHNASVSNGAAIIQYTANGTLNSKWYLEPTNKTVMTNSNTAVNSGYNRSNAATYAETYGNSHNEAYELLCSSGGDCTNFVSQCIFAGGLPMLPNGAIWLVADKTNIQNWFYLAGLPGYGDDWVSHSFTSATAFNQHWGQTNMRAYQTIEYASSVQALEDIEFLVWYLKKGDVIQFKNPDGTFSHSMIIQSDITICDGKHKGVTGSCPHVGENELLYAQHSTSESSNYINGHLRNLLSERDGAVVFIKIKMDG